MLRLLFLFVLAVHAADPLICFDLTAKINPQEFLLGIMDVGTLKTNGHTFQVQFMGHRKTANGSVLYFFDRQSEKILRVKKKDIQLQPKYAVTKRGLQNLIEIRCQTGSDCAAHSPYNAMEMMDEMGFLLTALRTKGIIFDKNDLWEKLILSQANAEKQVELGIVRDVFGKSHVPPQSAFQVDRLRENGFQAVLTRKMADVEAHL